MAFRLPVFVRQLILVATAVGMVGCMDSEVHRLVRFEPGAPKVQKKAPVTGVYRVKYATAAEVDQKGLPRIDETLLVVRKGERLGFYSSDEGGVVAFAGGQTFPLRTLPDTAVFCVWTYRARPPESDLGKDIADALHALGVMALIGGVVALIAWCWEQRLTGHGDPCGCDETDY